MAERFVYSTGRITIDTGDDAVVGVGTAFSGHDLAGAQLWAHPDDAAPIRVGSIAETDDGTYENLLLPLVTAYNGPALVSAKFELVDSVAIADGVEQFAIYSRFAQFLQQNGGLTFNIADRDSGSFDMSLVPENSLFVDDVTRTLYQWRAGVLEPVFTIAQSFSPKGAWADDPTSFSKDDLLQHGNFLFVSNINANVGHEPQIVDGIPISDAYWTWAPMPTPEAFRAQISFALDALGSVIATGVAGNLPIGYPVNVRGWSLIGDGIGSIVVDLWKGTISSPPTSGAASITGSQTPILTAQRAAESDDVSDWDIALAKSDVLAVNVVSCSGLTKATLTITVERVWPLS